MIILCVYNYQLGNAMLTKKWIICIHCKYFPNKADQIERRPIRFLHDRIEWECDVCSATNAYASGEAIVLPEASSVIIHPAHLLKVKSESEDAALFISIQIDGVRGGPVYYCPRFPRQIEESCGIQLNHLKSLDVLEGESEWFAKYRSFLKSYAKLTNNSLMISQRLAYEDYLVYILEGMVNSQQGDGSIRIDLLNEGNNFSFDLTSRNLTSGSELIDFLRIYALLQFIQEQKWLIQPYGKLMTKYQNRERMTSKANTLLFVGNKQKVYEIAANHKQIIILQKEGEDDTNIFGLNPLAPKPIINRIQQLNNKTNEDFATFFFKKEGERGVFRQELSPNETQLIKHLLLQDSITPEAKEENLKRALKKQLRGIRVKIVKLYCRLAGKEEKIVLFTFGWAAIERELLVQELDDQGQEEYHLQEDRLGHLPITLLPPPSPFLKKHYYDDQEPQQQFQEEQYL